MYSFSSWYFNRPIMGEGRSRARGACIAGGFPPIFLRVAKDEWWAHHAVPIWQCRTQALTNKGFTMTIIPHVFIMLSFDPEESYVSNHGVLKVIQKALEPCILRNI